MYMYMAAVARSAKDVGDEMHLKCLTVADGIGIAIYVCRCRGVQKKLVLSTVWCESHDEAFVSHDDVDR